MGEQSNGRFMNTKSKILTTPPIRRSDVDNLFYVEVKTEWSDDGKVIKAFTSNSERGMQDTCLSDLRPKVQAMFRAWYPKNMHILQAFFDWSLYLKLKGKRDYYSSQMIVHKLRWESAFNSDFDQYKINQNLGSALGRVVMTLDSRLEGMFRVQKHLQEN